MLIDQYFLMPWAYFREAIYYDQQMEAKHGRSRFIHRTLIVYEGNDARPGESHVWHDQYVAMSIVNIETKHQCFDGKKAVVYEKYCIFAVKKQICT